ncbi:MAG: DNA mismatch repair endonuclease MutL [Nitrospinota bacterium]|nr:DNA mismatch repair endonuclease MutL [Nitrospinota bacterium]
MPPELASQIAAGEVIERPANVIKELIENSLDSGATSIEVEVSLSRKRIRVKDNGAGIPSGELHLAVARHGTSKVFELDDIFNIGTYGFRGEALPSIASVSRFTLSSQRSGEKSGRTIVVDGGKTVSSHESPPIGGTEAIVENLFYNTPARRKFARANTTEMGHITGRIIQAALATPSVRYTFIKEKKRVMEFPPASSLLERVHQIFGSEYSENLVKMELADGTLHVSGLAGKPEFNRATNLDQYFFVNNRPVKDPLIRMSLARAFDDLIPRGRKPVIFIFIELPVNEVDVNVHPTKAEVRFSDPGRITSAIIACVRQSLSKYAGGGGYSVAAQTAGTDYYVAPALSGYPAPKMEPHLANKRETGMSAGFERSFELWSEPLRENDRSNYPPLGEIPVFSPVHGVLSPQSKVVGQLFDTLLIIEDGNRLVIMDQHTVHERILYEKFLKRLKEKKVERQQLLIPLTIDKKHGRADVIRAHLKTFDDLGWKIEEFGDTSFIVREIPAILSGKDIVPLIDELAESIAGNRDSDFTTMISGLVSNMACRAAVMAGDTLSLNEITAMVAELGRAELPYTCPHGRPVAINIEKERLFRHFGR